MQTPKASAGYWQRWSGKLVSWSLAGRLAASPLAALGSDEPRIRVVQDDAHRPVAIEAVGLSQQSLALLQRVESDPADYARWFSVVVGSAPAAKSLPAVSGTYRVEGGVLRFTPRYPLKPGLTYRVILRWDGPANPSDGHIEAEISISEVARTTAPNLLGISPSAAILPENHLRFYLTFATPMSQGEAYRHIELQDGQGRRIEAALLELGEELWDPSGTRLTVLLDPGRVKQALQPRTELGPVLKSGSVYSLVVHAGWRDVDGTPLVETSRKTFAVGPAVSERLTPARWGLITPFSGTRDPVVLHFPRALDRGLLERAIRVRTASGETVDGIGEIAEGEIAWSFRPTAVWPVGRFELLIDTRLEDTAGNSIQRAFETKISASGIAGQSVTASSIPFVVKQQ